MLCNTILEIEYIQIELKKYNNIFEGFPFRIPWFHISYTLIQNICFCFDRKVTVWTCKSIVREKYCPIFANRSMIGDQSYDTCIQWVREAKMFQPSSAFRVDKMVIVYTWAISIIWSELVPDRLLSITANAKLILKSN